MEFVLSHLW
jgi:hypothetical protein